MPPVCTALPAIAPPREHYDVFIIGGGINGAGVARDAAGRGYRITYVILGILAPALLLLRLSSFMAACAIWSTTSFAWFAKRYANASDFGI